MTDVRRLALAGLLAATLALTGGCGDDEPATTDGTGSPSGSTSPSPDDSEEPSEPTTEPGAYACDAIDTAALEAETGVRLKAPESAGEAGGDEGCSLFYRGAATVVSVELVVEHGTLREDLDVIRVVGDEKPEEVTVAGEPALVVSGDGAPVYVNLVTHLGERMLMVRALGDTASQVPELEELVPLVAEQVAAGVPAT